MTPGFFDDVRTMVWKEWREMFLQKATSRYGALAMLVVPLLVLGVLLPAQMGARFLDTAVNALVFLWLPLFLVISLVADSFAGERERKTLEALLASRLPDRAILFGKIAAIIGYGWGVSMAGYLLGLITVNVGFGKGHLMLPSLHTVMVIVGASLLGAGLASGAGVLVSLRASNVRQAQQGLMFAVMGLWFGLIFGFQALPDSWKKRLFAIVAGENLVRTELVVAAVLVVADAALLWACTLRFRRARLILD